MILYPPAQRANADYSATQSLSPRDIGRVDPVNIKACYNNSL